MGSRNGSFYFLDVVTRRRAELEGFAAVMEGVRNATAGLRDRAISGTMATSRYRR
jgi:hypothetical protein